MAAKEKAKVKVKAKVKAKTGAKPKPKPKAKPKAVNTAALPPIGSAARKALVLRGEIEE
jgi:hypothetical protein|tara:strand:+ start:315 stop:491 length:177 start_codon:yes stop_codon:yes gene_type:complete